VNIYVWLKDSKRFKEPAWLAAKMFDSEPARIITESALNKKNPLCTAAVRIFTSLLGSAAGNLALTGMATGGVYLSGGIPPQIIPFLKEDAFMTAFADKGRFKAFMKKIPVRVILNEQAALLGAACEAVNYA
jgi:glucokinase